MEGSRYALLPVGVLFFSSPCLPGRARSLYRQLVWLFWLNCWSLLDVEASGRALRSKLRDEAWTLSVLSSLASTRMLRCCYSSRVREHLLSSFCIMLLKVQRFLELCLYPLLIIIIVIGWENDFWLIYYYAHIWAREPDSAGDRTIFYTKMAKSDFINLCAENTAREHVVTMGLALNYCQQRKQVSFSSAISHHCRLEKTSVYSSINWLGGRSWLFSIQP